MWSESGCSSSTWLSSVCMDSGWTGRSGGCEEGRGGKLD